MMNHFEWERDGKTRNYYTKPQTFLSYRQCVSDKTRYWIEKCTGLTIVASEYNQIQYENEIYQ